MDSVNAVQGAAYQGLLDSYMVQFDQLSEIYPGFREDIRDKLLNSPDNDKMESPSIDKAKKMAERRYYLKKHPYKIWESNKGEFCVCIPDPTKSDGRAIRRRKTREEIEDLIVQYWKGQEVNPTIEEVFTEWNDRRYNLHKIAPATHTRDKQVFNRFYKEFGKRKLKSVHPSEFEDFLEEQIPLHSLKAKAFSGLKSVTRGFLLRAKKQGIISWNVNEVLDNLDVSDKEFTKRIIDDELEVYFDDEMEDVITYCKANPDVRNLGIALMFATGIRVGELVALKHEDFDGMVVDIKRSETTYNHPVTGKRIVEVQDKTKTTAGTREVIIPEKYKWIVDKLKLINPFGDYIFVEDGERLNTSKIRRRLTSLDNELGILRKSPHKIRKTYGSILLDNNVDHKLIEKQMGHKDILTTELHYHRDRKRITQKAAVINSIPEFATN